MGLWSLLFGSSTDESDVKVREKSTDRSVVRADKYVPKGGGHEHHGYNLDKATGGYKEYHGGENSDDRGYKSKDK
jgi:hypothetical protein